MTTKPLDLAQFEGHTPGPWEAHGATIYSADVWVDGDNHGGARIGSAYQDEMPTEARDEDFANAELIAAAPALLAECRRLQAENAKLRDALERCTGFIAPLPEDEDSECAIIHEQARAALAETVGA